MNCKLCKTTGGELVWSSDELRIVQVADPELPGFMRVIWIAHAAEMSDLSPAQQLQLMRVVFEVEKLVQQHMMPAKMNLASLGNQVAHLHWHVIPRFDDDAFFPDSIWSPARRSTDPKIIETRIDLASQLPALIQQQADNWLTRP